MVDKKRKSKRLSTRKKNKIVKMIRKQEKDRRKESREKRKSRAKIPKHILMTDEDVQLLNDIKNNERARKDLSKEILSETPLEKFIRDNDFHFIVVDPRDTSQIPDLSLFSGKSFCLVLSYKNDIPIEILKSLYENGSKKYKTFIVSNNEELSNFNNDFNIFIGQLEKCTVGILGEKQVGKNFIRRFISNPTSLFCIESKQGLSSLLRKCLPMRKVLYKDLLKDLVENQISKDDLSLHFSIRYFQTFEDFVELLAEKNNISKDKVERVCKILLDEFYNKRIIFYYNLNNELQITFNK